MNAPLSREETGRLRRLAEAATPGPWEAEDTYHPGITAASNAGDYTPIVTYGLEDADDENGVWGRTWEEGKANASFIAAANPETLRELLRGYDAWRDGIEKIEKERERLECIAETEITEESLRLSEGGIHWQKAIAGIEANAISRALDALRAGKRK